MRRRRGRRPRRGWVRALLGVGVALGLVLLVAAGLVAIVLTTPAGTRWALSRAVAWYDGSIAGRVSFTDTDGALAGELCIVGLRFLDGHDHPLLTVRNVCLRPRLWALLARTVELERLSFEGVALHVWPDAAWGDLAPPSPEPPPDEPPGPDLPVRITAPLVIDGLEVIGHREVVDEAGELVDPSEPLVRDAWLHAELDAEGRRASVVVRSVGAKAPVAEIELEDGEAAVQWDSPVLVLERLSLTSSHAVVEAASGRLDTKPEGEGETAALRYAADVHATAFVPLADDGPAWRVPVELRVEGTEATATATAQVWAPTLGRAELRALAAFSDGLGVTAFVHAVPDPPLGIPPVRAWLTARAPEDVPLRARLLATAPGVLLAATWDGARARARARVDGARVDAGALVEDGQLRRVEGTVAVASAARATAAIDRLVPAQVPRLQGTGRLSAACGVGETWSCALRAAVQHDADRLETTAELELGAEALEVRLQHLAGRLRGEPVYLAGPVRASVGEGSVSLTSLRLSIAGGIIEAAGRIAWEGSSSLRVRLAQLDLGVVPRFVPGVPVGGMLGGELTARGDPSRPTLHAEIGALGLRWDDEPLGELLVHADYDDGRARADVGWDRGATRVRLAADVPLALDPEGKRIALREHAAVRASLDVEQLALADVARWVNGPAIAGRVDATVRASGRLRDPIVEAELTGTDLRFEQQLVGHAHVAATAQGGEVRASLDLQGPAIDEVHVEATLPVALRPTRGGAVYRSRGHHELVARVVGLELDDLEPWLWPGAPDLAGRVSVEAEATAEADAVRGRVKLLGNELVLVGYDVGTTEATVELRDDELRAQAVVSGPWARYVGLDARVPLELHRPLQAPRWSPRAPISAHVELVDVELAGIGRRGPGPAIGGELAGTLDVSGTLRRPTLAGELTIDDLAHDRKPLGDVHLRTSYDGQTLVAKLQQRHVAAKVSAWGRVPLELDLATPTVAWHREASHRLSVRMEGVDQDLVGVLVDLPEDLRFQAAAHLEAQGTASEPRAMLQLRASLDGEDASLPIPVAVRVDVEPDRQDARVLLGTHGPEGLVIEAHAAAPLASLLAGRGNPSDVEVDAVARAHDFQLRELAPLLPDTLHDPRGRLTLDASLRGPLAGPHLAGSLVLHDGAITVVPLRQQFEDIEARARIDGPTLVLEQLRARSADGSAWASASLHLERGATRGSAMLTTHKLPVVRPGLPAMRLDLRVRADLDATRDVTALALHADEGFLDVLAVGPLVAAEPIPEDEGVIYVDAEALAQRHDSGLEAREPWLPENVAFLLVLDDPLRVRGPSADMDWTGRFELLRRPNVPPDATGTFRTEGGRVSMLGHDFDIESATIRFPTTGELDPYIDLIATTDTSEALVTMHVRGRMSRPRLELRSEPPLPESDVLALLVTGHADADQADPRELSAKAASLLAAAQNPALQRYMRDTVGIDRIGVGFGETVEQPIVTVGKRIGEKLYVEARYHHNAPRGVNEAEVQLEYRFAPSFSVETFFGDAAQGGVGLWWQRRFASRGQKRSQRPAPSPERAADPTRREPY